MVPINLDVLTFEFLTIEILTMSLILIGHFQINKSLTISIRRMSIMRDILVFYI